MIDKENGIPTSERRFMSFLTGEASLFGCAGIANGSSLQDDDRLLIGSERPRYPGMLSGVGLR
jgi:hypothetical protein